MWQRYLSELKAVCITNLPIYTLLIRKLKCITLERHKRILSQWKIYNRSERMLFGYGCLVNKRLFKIISFYAVKIHNRRTL